MAALPRHITTWEPDVATLDFRHSRFWAGHQGLNADEMLALARDLRAKRVRTGHTAKKRAGRQRKHSTRDGTRILPRTVSSFLLAKGAGCWHSVSALVPRPLS